ETHEEGRLDFSVNAGYVKNEEDADDDVFDLTTSSKNELFNNFTKNLTILDRLIKCHPIWYLPHVGRTAANHILMSQKP
uniref:Uncharacterized protein n=1 Tax=Romanomermis culicivorax TaxID=13658 RepID=A0A915IKG6_ROMCU